MKLLNNYFKALLESEGEFRTIKGDPVDFFKYVSKYQPDLEDMNDDQLDILVEVLEGIQVYLDDYAPYSRSKAEQKLNLSFQNMFNRYRYRYDTELTRHNLDPDAETVYEWLIRFES